MAAVVPPQGDHHAAWRRVDTAAGPDVNAVVSLARTAEQAKFDAVLIEDPAVPFREQEMLSRVSTVNDSFEATTLAAALSSVTSHIGLVGTASTTYHEPYHLARIFASIDYVSKGRAGWNMTGSHDEGGGADLGHVTRTDETERHEEFFEVVTRLWDSFDDDAFLHAKESGEYFLPRKLHTLNHTGRHFSVAGPLNIARPPQGRPVIVQEAATETERDFAARSADIVLSSERALPRAKEFHADIQRSATAHGRAPGEVKVFTKLSVITAPTGKDARGGADLASTPVIAGTPATIADHMEEWLDASATDGFALSFPVLPSSMDEFIGLVLPELRRRGLFRTEYTGTTLRENLGLPRPSSHYTYEN
jgi:FMN-dependent oxidoreductase (nitrilotriacetate monooxygenase family)